MTLNPRSIDGSGIIALGVLAFLIGVHFIGAQQKAVANAPGANDWLRYYGPPEGATVPLDEINPMVTPVRPLAPSASTSGTSSIGAGGVYRLRFYPETRSTPFQQASGGDS